MTCAYEQGCFEDQKTPGAVQAFHWMIHPEEAPAGESRHRIWAFVEPQGMPEAHKARLTLAFCHKSCQHRLCGVWTNSKGRNSLQIQLLHNTCRWNCLRLTFEVLTLRTSPVIQFYGSKTYQVGRIIQVVSIQNP